MIFSSPGYNSFNDWEQRGIHYRHYTLHPLLSLYRLNKGQLHKSVDAHNLPN